MDAILGDAMPIASVEKLMIYVFPTEQIDWRENLATLTEKLALLGFSEDLKC